MLSPAEMRSNADLVDALSAARAEAGLTIRALAHVCGVPHTTIGGYLKGQHLPHPGNVEPFLDMVAALGFDVTDPVPWMKLLSRLAARRTPQDLHHMRPFPGLAAFRTEEAPLFFGREVETDALLNLVSTLRGGGTTQRDRMGIVVGVSGSGKSSLVRAGLVPSLGADWRVEIVRPGSDPAQAIRDAVAELGESGDRLLVVDQMEELWTLGSGRGAADVASILQAAESRGVVVIGTVRADFYADMTGVDHFAAALRHHQLLLGSIARADLARTITGPADIFGIELAPGLVTRLLDDMHRSGTPGASLPHLAHCLSVMWERRDRRALTHEQYEAVGKLEGAVAQSAEAVYAETDDAQRETIRSLLLRLVVIDGESPPASGSLELDELPDQAQRSLAEKLTAARLLANDGVSLTLGHESLVSAWPRLSRWIESDREVLTAARMVRREALAWAAAAQEPSLLLRGSRLSAAQQVLESAGDQLTPRERDYVVASTRAAEAELQLARRRLRRTRRMLVVSAVMATLALVASIGLALSQRRLSTERNDALSRQYAAESARYADDPVLSSQLALAAYAQGETMESRSAVAKSAAGSVPTLISGPLGQRVLGGCPARNLLAAGGEMHEIVLYEVSASPRAVARVEAPIPATPAAAAYAVEFSSDGQFLAAGGIGGTVGVWDLSDLGSPRLLGEVETGSTVYALAFSSDGQRLYVANYAVGLIEVTLDGLTITRRAALEGGLHALVELGDGRIASGGPDGMLRVWSQESLEQVDAALVQDEATVSALAVTGTQIYASTDLSGAFRVRLDAPEADRVQRVATFTSWVNDVAVSPDATLVAFGGSNTEIRVGSTAQDSDRQVLETGNVVTSLAFVGNDRLAYGTRAGQTVIVRLPLMPGATGSADVFGLGWATARPLVITGNYVRGTLDATVVDVGDPLAARVVGRISEPGIAGGGPVSVAPDGRTLVAATLDGHLIGWDINNEDSPRQVFDFTVTDVVIEVVEFVDNQTLLVSADDSLVRLVSLADPSHPRTTTTFRGGRGALMQSSMSGDGQLVSAGSSSGEAFLWRTSAPERPIAAIEWQGILYCAALNDDGTRLAISGTTREIRVYDVSDPAAPSLMQTYAGSTGTAFALEYAPDGSLAAVFDDGHVVVWSPQGNHLERELTISERSALHSVKWSPDSRYLAVAGEKAFFRIYPRDGAQAYAAACASVGDHYTPTTWASIIPEAQVPAFCASPEG